MSTKRILYQKKVHSIRTISHGVFVLGFNHDFNFKAGQVIAVDLVPDGQPRLYSIASGEKEDLMEILFDEKKNGKLTPFLSVLKPGDSVYVSEPFGTFTTVAEKGYWIASGTGVAPFVSMVRSGLGLNKMLIHGGKLDENFYFSNLLEKLMPERYIRCNSQQEDTKYFRGRLTKWLQNQPYLDTDVPYYLCGSAEMVVEVRDLLIARGIPFRNIISETYF
ncbi:MAG: FAD-binding oxidoreductase [Paludibacter sp.]|nr:FAD-binding oxidoreductase [Paludibacter sp.]